MSLFLAYLQTPTGFGLTLAFLLVTIACFWRVRFGMEEPEHARWRSEDGVSEATLRRILDQEKHR